MKKLSFFLVFLYLVVGSAIAQHPRSNIYLFDMKAVSDSVYQFTNPKFLTEFNKDGYNNQPVFINSGELFISVQFPEDTTQTDIYSLNFRTKTVMQVTDTKESEYSPCVMADYNHFSVVRVEAGEEKSQVLWKYPLDRSDAGSAVIKNIHNVGYYHWINKDKVALYIDSEPSRMIIIDGAHDQVLRLSKNIGRCFVSLANDNIAFVHKVTDQTWFIKELDVNNYKSRIIATTLTGSEDFVKLNDGSFLMGQGSRLYRFDPGIDTDWLEIADFRDLGIINIQRLAVSYDGKIALVSVH